MLIRRLVALLVPVALSFPAPAGMLYKSVSRTGTIIFSDVPPDGGARLIAQQVISDSGMPRNVTPVVNASPLAGVVEYDSEIARANEQVDLAEHALALARQGTWSPSDGIRIRGSQRTLEDEKRIDYCRKGVILARRQLLEVLGERKAAPMQVALR